MPTLDTAYLESLAKAVILSMPRLLAIFAVVPFLSGRMLTGLPRNGIVVLLALFIAPSTTVSGLEALSTFELLAIAIKEGLIGLLLGLGFGLFIWAIQSVGDLIDFQTGAANAAFFDPVSEHQGGPTGGFLVQLAVVLFVAGGGLLALLGVVIDSYTIWPIAAPLPRMDRALEAFVIREGDTLFTWTVKLAAPVLLILLLAELGMGLISRFVPQLNVFVVSQPLKGILATLMLALFMFFIYDALKSFFDPRNGVLEFLKGSLSAAPS